jgi:hypothetical protein
MVAELGLETETPEGDQPATAVASAPAEDDCSTTIEAAPVADDIGIDADGDAAAAEAARWAPIRIDYEETDETQNAICARYGVTHSQLNWRIRRDLWVRRYRSKVVDRPQIIVRMFRVLERQVMDLETEMSEMSRNKSRSGDREAALLGKLAGNLEKLVALDLKVPARESGRRQTRQMQDIRNKLIERIAELRRD